MKKDTMVIYKDGALNIKTVSVDGINCMWSDKTVQDYLKEGFELLPLQDALLRIEAAEEEKYIKPFIEINEAEYQYFLGVLPPECWKVSNGVEIFRLIEYQTRNITLHLATINSRYFKALRRTTTDYKHIADEIYRFIRDNPLKKSQQILLNQ